MQRTQGEPNLPQFLLTIIGVLAQGCTQIAGVQDWHPIEGALSPTDGGSTLEGVDAGAPGACEEGTWRCQDTALQNCLTGQWQTLKTCASPQLCNAIDSMCIPPTCSPGQAQCRSNTLLRCNASQSGWDETTCASAGLCNSQQARCDPAVCSEGQVRCSGAELQWCNATLTGWATGATCDTAELCDAQAGICRPPTCAPGEYQCQGKSLMSCNDGRTGWTQKQHCNGSQTCDAVKGSCV